jgi:sterol desaturase/sphingolipid hydroxylase (fatty acid hydroxylase superfamily)
MTLEPRLPNPVELAIPAFILLVLLEIGVARAKGLSAYELRDTAASLAMGLGNLVIGLGAGAAAYVALNAVHAFRLFDIGYAWWSFALILFAEDLTYYGFHRLSHRSRVWWAAHVNHHSSQHYNLSTALRQTWTGGLFEWVLWLPLALVGFPPALIVFEKGVSLVYQFWIHTETIGRLPAWFEAVMNTPSHHRVHHATNPRYLDRNYAGIFIIWDRLFGSFAAEEPSDPCRYGLVKNIGTFNPLRIALHEWVSILRDLKAAPGWRSYPMLLLGLPGRSIDGSRQTTDEIRAAWRARLAAKPGS